MTTGVSKWRKWLRRFCIFALVAGVILFFASPYLGAALMIYPYRVTTPPSPPEGCVNETLKGDGIDLAAWTGKAEGQRRGTLVYLHGISDSRRGSAGVLTRFRKRGFDVIAFDSRAHGASGGKFCSYGVREKEDLRKVIDTAAPGPVVLIGSSLGGAVALQEAAIDPRVVAVVAAEAFSDLRTVATVRSPSILPANRIEAAFRVAEKTAGFRISDADTVRAAASPRIPVLVIHGAADRDTPPDHARRIHDALQGPKRLILVPGATHNHSLRDEVWPEIERWIDGVLEPPTGLPTFR